MMIFTRRPFYFFPVLFCFPGIPMHHRKRLEAHVTGFGLVSRRPQSIVYTSTTEHMYTVLTLRVYGVRGHRWCAGGFSYTVRNTTNAVTTKGRGGKKQKVFLKILECFGRISYSLLIRAVISLLLSKNVARHFPEGGGIKRLWKLF